MEEVNGGGRGWADLCVPLGGTHTYSCPFSPMKEGAAAHPGPGQCVPGDHAPLLSLTDLAEPPIGLSGWSGSEALLESHLSVPGALTAFQTNGDRCQPIFVARVGGPVGVGTSWRCVRPVVWRRGRVCARSLMLFLG
jgi:hypothetical protein